MATDLRKMTVDWVEDVHNKALKAYLDSDLQLDVGLELLELLIDMQYTIAYHLEQLLRDTAHHAALLHVHGQSLYNTETDAIRAAFAERDEANK